MHHSYLFIVAQICTTLHFFSRQEILFHVMMPFSKQSLSLSSDRRVGLGLFQVTLKIGAPSNKKSTKVIAPFPPRCQTEMLPKSSKSGLAFMMS